jgi:outer membrane lipopolysaccharide assembly protein LptE/RlpB
LRKIVYCLAFAVSCLLSGCGYHLTSEAQTPSLTAGRTIAIPMWRNKSYRMNLENVMTGCLVDEFALRNGGKVVSEDAADLLLTGTIVSYTEAAVTYSSADLVSEYRMTMTVDAVLSEKSSKKVLWKGTLEASQDYPALSNPNVSNRMALQQNSEDAALLEISRKIAQKLFQKMSENF